MPSSTREVAILVVADPGLPTRRFRAVQLLFEAEISARLDSSVTVHVQSQIVGTWPDGSLRLEAAARASAEFDSVDLTLVLTEMPRHAGGRLLLAEVLPEARIAAFFWPTLGIVSREAKIVDVLVDGASRLVPELRRDGRASGAMNSWAEDPESSTLWLRARRPSGEIRTVIGMVTTNAPWRTVPKLSNAMAAAAAAGAFGIFYNSIWQMAASLSTGRLLLIALAVMAAMVAWLIGGNRLWDRPLHKDSGGPTLLYNISTVATLFLCVLALYLILAALILLGSFVIITPEFMTQILGEKARFTHYTGIAWLSASLGVAAGGIGAGFDSETDLRQLTHARRERQRERDDPEIGNDGDDHAGGGHGG